MKNFLLSLMAIFMMSSFVFANPSNGDDKPKNKTVRKINSKVKGEPKVDSFKVVSESSGEDSAGRKFCSITVNYYNQGQYVGQHTYTGYTCPIFGQDTCREWRESSFNHINNWVHENETMYPFVELTC